MTLLLHAPPAVADDTSSAISALSPVTVEEAVACMDVGISYFHERDDHRATFLAAYRVITEEMRIAIRHTRVFNDPAWMNCVVGTFATLYFRSLRTFNTPPSTERAWKIAHAMALAKRSSVLQDVMLGVNAHIKYDLPFALETNLHEVPNAHDLAVRRRDHERANRVLNRSIALLQDVIPRTYGGSLHVFKYRGLCLDTPIASLVGIYNRGRVWRDAVALLEAPDAPRRAACIGQINAAAAHTARIILRWFTPALLGAAHRSRIPIVPLGARPARP